jgi:hypothetical protein
LRTFPLIPGGVALRSRRQPVPAGGGGYFRRQPGGVMVEINRTEEKGRFKNLSKNKKDTN